MTRAETRRVPLKSIKNIKNLLKRSIEILKPIKIKEEREEKLADDEIMTFHEDILKYQLKREKMEKLEENFLNETLVSKSNRKILVQWMWDMKETMGLEQETLELAVSILDRSLSLVASIRRDLQILGLTALFVARKVEEADNFTGSFDREALLKMEARILGHLGFHLNYILPSHFLCYFQQKLPENVYHMAIHFVNISLLNGISLLPSVLAETSLHLAAEILAFPMETVASKRAILSLAEAILEHQVNSNKWTAQDRQITDHLQKILAT